jgi:hypothetical protein
MLGNSGSRDFMARTPYIYHKLIMGTVYRKPGEENTSTFWDDLQTSLSLAMQSGIANIILTGDFNADKSTNLMAGGELAKFLTSNSLYQHVIKPTRIADGVASILDLLITNNRDLVKDTDVTAPVHDNDHSTVIATLTFKTHKAQSYKRTMWNYKNSDMNKYRKNLLEGDLDNCIDPLDAEKSCNVWTEKFMSITKKSIINKVVTIRPNDKSWYNNNTLGQNA